MLGFPRVKTWCLAKRQKSAIVFFRFFRALKNEVSNPAEAFKRAGLFLSR
jgi:hypothetical protein